MRKIRLYQSGMAAPIGTGFRVLERQWRELLVFLVETLCQTFNLPRCDTKRKVTMEGLTRDDAIENFDFREKYMWKPINPTKKGDIRKYDIEGVHFWIHNSFDRSISFLVRRYAGISFLLCYISFLLVYRERSVLKKFFSRERTCQSAAVWPCECNQAERYWIRFLRTNS